MNWGKQEFNSTPHQSTCGIAACVNTYTTKTRALACKILPAMRFFFLWYAPLISLPQSINFLPKKFRKTAERNLARESTGRAWLSEAFGCQLKLYSCQKFCMYFRKKDTIFLNDIPPLKASLRKLIFSPKHSAQKTLLKKNLARGSMGRVRLMEALGSACPKFTDLLASRSNLVTKNVVFTWKRHQNDAFSKVYLGLW